MDSATGEVKLAEEEIGSPGYHFRAFDGVGSSGTLPDGTYRIRIVVRSLLGNRGIDPPDTAVLYVRVYESENYHIISRGVSGASFFHDTQYHVTRVVDTAYTGEVLNKVTLYKNYFPYYHYWETVQADREELGFSPVLSSNDSVLIFSVPDSVVIIKNPLLCYDVSSNTRVYSCGKFPVISPCGDKIIYYRDNSIVVEDWKHRRILETFPVSEVRFLGFHPYHDMFLYSRGGDLILHTPSGDSLVFHSDGGIIEEACYHPDGIRMLLLISDSVGKKILHFDPLRSETLIIEESQILKGISVTPDGRFITYNQGRYVIGFPAGKIRKEPLVLIKSPLVGNDVEQKITIRGTVINNVSPDTTVYAHLTSFKVEWGYGEYPDEFSNEGVGCNSSDEEFDRINFEWNQDYESWEELPWNNDFLLVKSIFRDGITYGGVVGYWYNGPINFIELEHNVQWMYGKEKLNIKINGQNIYYFSKPYPNPAFKDLNFKFMIPEKGNVIMEIFTVDGRLLGRLVEMYEAGCHVIKLSDILKQNKIPTGIYFYRFKYREKLEKGKFVWIKSN